MPKKKILVAPLDWGLGHATRCVPIIEYLLEQGIDVVLASSGRAKKFLKNEFPKLKIISLRGYEVNYAKKNVQLDFITQIPKIFTRIKEENEWINENLEKLKIDAIISDNRYGIYSNKVPSVLITHQLNIEGPKIVKPFLKKKTRGLISKFSEVWIPDYKGEKSLAGRLSVDKSNHERIKFIGPLSRLKSTETIPTTKYRYVGIVSGPENQRTIFEKLLTNAFIKSGKKCLLITGKVDGKKETIHDSLTIVSHLNSIEIVNAIEQSEIVVCRSGYSSIMDLIALNKGAVLVPTPGQTEQEYLASNLDKNFGFKKLDQLQIKENLLTLSLPSKSNVTLPFNEMTIIQNFIESF